MHRHGRAINTAGDTLEKIHLLRLAIEHAAKVRTVAQRPVHRIRRDTEHPLQFIQQIERRPGRTIQLVHEGEDWNAALPAHLEKLSRLRLNARSEEHTS